MTKNRLGACRQNPFGACRQNLPALILIFGLLMAWQLGAMKVNAAYILPTPVQILRKLWELRVILFTVHLPATMTVTFVGLAISIVLGLGLAIASEVAKRHHIVIDVESRMGQGTTFKFTFPMKNGKPKTDFQ